MPFKVVAFFDDVKRKVVKIQRHWITAPKVIVILHKSVPILLLFLKTFEFVSFHTQNKLVFFSICLTFGVCVCVFLFFFFRNYFGPNENFLSS